MRFLFLVCLIVVPIQSPRACSPDQAPSQLYCTITRPPYIDGAGRVEVAFTQPMMVNECAKNQVAITCRFVRTDPRLSGRLIELTDLKILKNGLEANELHVIDITFLTGTDSPDFPPNKTPYIDISATFFNPDTTIDTPDGTTPYTLSANLVLSPPGK
ncbi:MAG: hypothetical protein B7Z75_12020 [Acidocella sp. 20-57-95]|nr:MAG: hypothetical protein B7Z75_12020 [Acidocella sp. 20-57-95]HQT63191.1 hypothetical protein [Acidocella sp.]HQU05207.1 hypothetical protein [Acidocella sp.]